MPFLQGGTGFAEPKALCVLQNIYMLFTGLEVRTGKIFLSRSQKRPETEGRGTFLRLRQNIFQYGPT